MFESLLNRMIEGYNLMGIWMVRKYKLPIPTPLYLNKYYDTLGFYENFVNNYLPSLGKNNMEFFLKCNYIIPFYLREILMQAGKRPKLKDVQVCMELKGITPKNIMRIFKKIPDREQVWQL